MQFEGFHSIQKNDHLRQLVIYGFYTYSITLCMKKKIHQNKLLEKILDENELLIATKTYP